MPDRLRPIAARMQRRFGSEGLEFARARVETKAFEAVAHPRRSARARMKDVVPDRIRRLVEPYGLRPGPKERRPDPAAADPLSRRGSARRR